MIAFVAIAPTRELSMRISDSHAKRMTFEKLLIFLRGERDLLGIPSTEIQIRVFDGLNIDIANLEKLIRRQESR